MYVEFDQEKVRVWDVESKKVLAEGKEEVGLYHLPLALNKSPEALSSERVSSNRWHLRLGHLNNQAGKKMVSNSLISTNCKQISNCDSCMRTKSTASPHKSSVKIYSAPLDLIYADKFSQ